MNECVISFDYNKELIDKIKEIPIRMYNPIDKNWFIPYCFLKQFTKSLGGLPYDIEYINKEIDEDKASQFKFKTEPFEHQLACFEFGKTRDKFLLGDEPGLGKTKSIIDLALYKKLAYGYNHCLIICGIKTLTYNWVKEISIHSDEACTILGQKNSKDKIKIGTNADKLKMLNNIDDLPYFIITNIETIRDKSILAQLHNLIKLNKLEMIAVDEFHKVKNPDSKQGKALLTLKPFTRIAMTGTPLVNSPLDLYSILNWLDIEKHNFYIYKNHYCRFDDYKRIIGFKNLSELNTILEYVMLRRKKSEVLNLPPKIYTTEYLEMDKEQQLIYDSVRNQIIDNIDKVSLSNNPLTELIRLRQATGFTGILNFEKRFSCKYDRCCDIIEEVVDSGGKVLVVSQWVEVLNPLYNYLSAEGFNPAIITGQVKDHERSEQEYKFTNDDSCKVMLGSIAAMGVGLTFTVANTVIFLDSPWNRATKEQAEDRCHRIGTNGTVNIITLVCKDTIDERIEDIVYSKGKISDAIVDGEIKTPNKRGLLNKLLNI
jgi:SNF2 family DNA or RNA helicase